MEFNKKYSVYLVLVLAVILLSCGKTGQQEMSPDETGSTVIDSLQQFITYNTDAIVGETVYIPVYSHIYQHNRTRTFNLTATLSIRNTDLNSPIILKKVYYYDSDGILVHKYLDETEIINPLSSTSYVVEEEDLRGGVGANFLVLWEAKQNVTEPVFEAVMISTAQNQGISFISVGRIIDSLNTTSQ